MLGLVTISTFDDDCQYVASKKYEVIHKIACDQVVTFNQENLIDLQILEEDRALERRGYKACKPKK